GFHFARQAAHQQLLLDLYGAGSESGVDLWRLHPGREPRLRSRHCFRYAPWRGERQTAARGRHYPWPDRRSPTILSHDEPRRFGCPKRSAAGMALQVRRYGAGGWLLAGMGQGYRKPRSALVAEFGPLGLWMGRIGRLYVGHMGEWAFNALCWRGM